MFLYRGRGPSEPFAHTLNAPLDDRRMHIPASAGTALNPSTIPIFQHGRPPYQPIDVVVDPVGIDAIYPSYQPSQQGKTLYQPIDVVVDPIPSSGIDAIYPSYQPSHCQTNPWCKEVRKVNYPNTNSQPSVYTVDKSVNSSFARKINVMNASPVMPHQRSRHRSFQAEFGSRC